MKNLTIVTLAILALAYLVVGATETMAATKKYPLSTCIVTDNKLGSMGKPYRLVHQGQEIKLCCKPCLKKFNKNPGKYLQKLD